MTRRYLPPEVLPIATRDPSRPDRILPGVRENLLDFGLRDLVSIDVWHLRLGMDVVPKVHNLAFADPSSLTTDYQANLLDNAIFGPVSGRSAMCNIVVQRRPTPRLTKLRTWPGRRRFIWRPKYLTKCATSCDDVIIPSIPSAPTAIGSTAMTACRTCGHGTAFVTEKRRWEHSSLSWPETAKWLLPLGTKP